MTLTDVLSILYCIVFVSLGLYHTIKEERKNDKNQKR